MTGSVFPALEALLPRVAKPVQYVGGELNAQVKDWDDASVRWALMYPDAYEVGLPNQGVQILYEVLNERPDTLAERCYAVWPDLEALMRESRVPAFTVDAHRPLGAFDALGVSWTSRDDLGKVSLVGAGMKSHPGVAAKTFATLEQAGIEASLVSTSPIKIACHVPSSDVDKAVQLLHEAFELG